MSTPTHPGPIKHGHASNGKSTPEYVAWAHMRQRCLNPNDKGYAAYGGRGIAICARWLESFANFLTDMGPRPSTAHSIERKDNNAGYSPSNCMWATPSEQNNNTRHNVWLTFKGETRNVAQWTRKLGFPRGLIRTRLLRGWSVERTLSAPLDLLTSGYRKGIRKSEEAVGRAEAAAEGMER